MYSNVREQPSDTASGDSPRPKNTTLAVALNCLLPGLGLAYLGRWRLAIANFLVVGAVLIGCSAANQPTINEYIHWVLLVLVVGSGAIAHGVAKSPS